MCTFNILYMYTHTNMQTLTSDIYYIIQDVSLKNNELVFYYFKYLYFITLYAHKRF